MTESRAEPIPAATIAAPARAAAAWAWGIVPLLMALSFLGYIDRVSISTAGDTRLMAQYGFSPTRMGTIYSAFYLTYTAFMIPGGLFIDRVGPRRALLTVGFGSALFVALTGLVGWTIADGATAFLGLMVARGLFGLISAPMYPACAAAVGRWVPPGSRSRTNGLVTGSALVGVAVTPLAVGALIDRVDWPAAFLVLAVLTLALSLGWWLFLAAGTETGTLEESTGPAATRARADWWGLLTNRSLLVLTVSYGAVGYFQYLFFYWMTYYFEKVLMLPETASRGYAAIPPLAMAVGMPLGGWLSDRLEHRIGRRGSRRIVPMVGMTLGGLWLLAGVFATSPVWIVTWFSLALGAVGMAEGPFWVTAIELGGRRGGSSGALFNTGGNAGGMLAPIVTPWVGQLYGWAAAVGLGGLICLLGVVLWAWVDLDDDDDA